ncbi:E3 ubiquitin-protein ligase sina-like isoform X2 [Topomyia yanbarensis]|uniref:E3 ubiquitin-protein ligase sina-like isoform X2 n=1 Tax=Topomyia yanbarensis TaxID=2498891 RepID=UPI00273C2A4B|nr:E3 ubiquitin-protein ligase sina-like isoform X2 [Topomyia yanbarensis]
MDLEKLKCVLCHKFPEEEVYECSGKHLGCKSCVDRLNVRLCQCSEYFDKKKSNPIEQMLKNTKTECLYSKAGCTWTFSATDMRRHQEECKYRPYRCIASMLNVLKCNWTGLQHEIENHLLKGHPVLGNPFSYFQESEIPFSEAKSMGSIKLVDAFSKQFLLYFFSNATTKMVYFMIIYFGRREEAQQYYYEFEIKCHDENEIHRIKFTEQCVADCDDLKQRIEDERCVVVSFKTVKNFLHGGSIPFRFILKKIVKDVEPVGRERRVSESNSRPMKSKPTPFVFPQKGKMHANLNRSSSVGTSVNANNNGGNRQASGHPPLRKSSAPANVPRAQTAGISSDQKAPEFSSINRVGVCGQDSPIIHQEPSPLMTPSINRNDAFWPN